MSRVQLSWLCHLKTCHTNTKTSNHTTSCLLKLQPLTQYVFGWGISRVFGVFNNLWAQIAPVFDEQTWQQGLGHSEPETGQRHWQSWTEGRLQARDCGLSLQLRFLQQSTSGSTPGESHTPEKFSLKCQKEVLQTMQLAFSVDNTKQIIWALTYSHPALPVRKVRMLSLLSGPLEKLGL